MTTSDAQEKGYDRIDKHPKSSRYGRQNGIIPKETRYQTEKQFLRDAIDDVASTAKSPEEFAKILDEKYHIIFKISRNRYSYLHPSRKNISLEGILGPYTQKIFS